MDTYKNLFLWWYCQVLFSAVHAETTSGHVRLPSESHPTKSLAWQSDSNTPIYTSPPVSEAGEDATVTFSPDGRPKEMEMSEDEILKFIAIAFGELVLFTLGWISVCKLILRRRNQQSKKENMDALVSISNESDNGLDMVNVGNNASHVYISDRTK